MTTQTDNLVTSAVLVTFSVSVWDARKFDRKATADVAERNDAKTNAGRYNKHLLPDAASHAAVIKAAGLARTTHYAYTLPWSDEGKRLLPVANYQDYTDAMRTLKSNFENCKESFIDELPSLIDTARQALGRMWNSLDYPTQREARRKFGWTIEFEPVPNSSDIRVNLPASEIANIERCVENRVTAAINDAVKDAWRRLHEAVNRLHSAAQPDARVYASTVENISFTCDMLAKLNITNDPDLEAMRLRVANELSGLNAEDIRNNDLVRASVKQTAEQIMDAMAAFYAPPKVAA